MLLTQKPLVQGLLPLGRALPARTPLRRQCRSGSLLICSVLAAPPRPAASPLPQHRPQPTSEVRWPRTTVQMHAGAPSGQRDCEQHSLLMLLLRAFCVVQKQCGYRWHCSREGATVETMKITMLAFLPGLPATCGVYLVLPDDVYTGLANIIADTVGHAFSHCVQVDLSAAPPFTLADLKNAIPAHCYQKNSARSLTFLARDVAIVFGLAAAAYAANTWCALSAPLLTITCNMIICAAML